MHRLFLLTALFITLGLFGGVAWADEPQMQPDGAKLVFPSVVDLGLPEPPNLDWKALSLKTSFRAKAPRNQQSLLDEEEWRVLWNVFATSPLSDFHLVGEGELMSAPLDPVMREGSATNGYVRLRLKHDRAWEKSSYGAEYRYVAKDFTSYSTPNLTRDQERVEVWGKWRFGIARVKTSLTEFWNNVDKDPRRPRLITTQGKVAVDIALPVWPRFRLAYTRGASASSQEPDGSTPQQRWLETIGISLHYGKAAWKATLASTYTATTDRLRSGKGTMAFFHRLSVTYRLTNAITITPAFSLSEKQYQPSDMRTIAPSASLSLTYRRLFDIFDVTTYGSYTSSRRSDGRVDTRNLNTTASLVWNLGQLPLGEATLSFKVTYARYLDVVSRASSYDKLTAGIILAIAFL